MTFPPFTLFWHDVFVKFSDSDTQALENMARGFMRTSHKQKRAMAICAKTFCDRPQITRNHPKPPILPKIRRCPKITEFILSAIQTPTEFH